MNRNLFFILTTTFALTVLTSCSEYQKVLKSSDYNSKYELGMKLYEDEEYYKAQSLFEDIMPLFKGTAKAEGLAYNFANCYYKQEDYQLAAYYFENFTKTYPYSDMVEEATYVAAYCYYLNSPRPSLDPSDTRKAIMALQSFINKFPNSERVNETTLYIDELRTKLEEKSYMNSKLYFKLGHYQAATISLKNSLKDYPDTKYREEIMYLTVKSSFLLAEASISTKQGERYQDTISEYYAFIDEYPESKFLKEIEKMYTQSVNHIKSL